MFKRETVHPNAFNPNAELPFELRLKDFEIAMQDVYDFFYDVNLLFQKKGLPRLDDELTKTGHHVRDALGHADRQHGEAFTRSDAKPLF
jgi:hypothetical protein